MSRYEAEIQLTLLLPLAAADYAGALAEAEGMQLYDNQGDYLAITVHALRVIGPGAPSQPLKQEPRKRVRTTPKKRAKSTTVRNASVEQRAAAAWSPGMGVKALETAAQISRASAQKYHAKFSAQQAAL